MDASPSSNCPLLEALIARGWRFRDTDQIRGLLTAHGLSITTSSVDSVESELLNIDLRSIGGKCLPLPSLLRKTSHLKGPLLLQVVISGAYAASNFTVTASVPVQNQVAAQRLLQKTSQPNFKDRNSRRHRGKVKEEDSSVITLDEWERRKTGIDLRTMHEHSDISQDEVLARQLQDQFELENFHAEKGFHEMKAKSIRMSMFNFERDDARAEFRGRGTGRGRGRRIRGRGRVSGN